ncbi:protein DETOXIFICATION 45, chloroplastic isoform X2 [Brachypodium distachyon]|uniref:protein DETOXIFICATION 45, chloroplastic isoform X2 n=1 Tax=Brachypodium distachyon TaxID=15368 RepID=UPI0001D43C39|nr:protein DETOXIFICATION 45, chloroplastic isoform X2 [Brachypodium distachyon]|eukprot:XP_010236195.1 protein DETOXIFICATION 45, chloroplastic isoform X2 [Brachypodium distachyon]
MKALVYGQPALLFQRPRASAATFASSSSSSQWPSLSLETTLSRNLAKGSLLCRRRITVHPPHSIPRYASNQPQDDEGTRSSSLAKDALLELHPAGVGSELILLALPAVLGQAIDPLAQLMETAYIGRLGALELASAGIGVAIFNILSKIFNIPLLSIATSFVAEDISKNASKHSNSGKLELPSVSSALILAAGIGIIEALALFLGSGLFLKLMGVSPASPMHKSAQLFLSLRALGAPANVIMLAVQGIFRGFKDTKTPVIYIGLGNLSAVVLLPLLIYGFQLGITGAAISTVASQYIIAILLVWSLSKRAVLLPPRMDQLDFSGYLKSGGMLLGRTLSILLTMTIGTSMAARQGPTAMAAHQICLQVWLAVSLLADALAVSAQALIASSYAILDYKRVQKIAMFALQIGVVSGLALAAGLYASFGNIARLFTSDPEVLMVVKSCALFVCASQPINALAFIFDGLHYGVSDFDYIAQATIVVGIMSSLVLLYAPSVFGLAGVWAGLTTLMGLRMAAGFLRLLWKTGPWSFLHEERKNEVQPFA